MTYNGTTLNVNTTNSPLDPSQGNIVCHNTATGNSSARAFITAKTEATGGDPVISWDISGVGGYSLGIDNSDS